MTWKRLRIKKLLRVLLVVFLVGMTVALSVAVVITRYGTTDLRRKSDCIIVPGARVDADGTLGPSLEGRVRQAVRLYQEGWAPHLIMTGGRGGSGAIESVSARAFAHRLGVPMEAMFVEEVSHTTWDNLYYARAVMREQGWRTAIVCSDPFHLRRCIWMCQDLGIDAVPVPTYLGPAWNQPDHWLFYTARECVGVAKYVTRRAVGLDAAD